MAASENNTPSYAFVVFLVLLFGQGSWIGINAIWVELPLLISLGIPEQFEIASWLVIIVQVANIGPVLFTAINYLTPKGFRLEESTNYAISAAGTVTCAFLVFYWDVFTIWGLDNRLHSTYLIVFVFLLAVVDCTSNVTFPPFMVRLKSHYMAWFFIGMGLSGMIPSLVALIQGVGGPTDCVANSTYNSLDEKNGSLLLCTSWVYETQPARFGPKLFFGFLTFMMLACFLAYLSLNHLPLAKKEYAVEYLSEKVCLPKGGESSLPKVGESSQHEGQYELVSTEKDTTDEDISDEAAVTQLGRNRSMLEFATIFIILGLANALANCVLPSIQSFSAGAYGLNIYLLASTFGSIANPVACFVVMVKPSQKLALSFTLFLIGSLAGCYCFLTALTSPNPPFRDGLVGSVLVILAWFVSLGCLHYVRASIGLILRTEPNNQRVLLMCYGVVNQVGSLIGAIIIFPLVNYTDWFVPYYPDPCADRPQCVAVVGGG